MSKSPEKETVSIRVNLEEDILERIDHVAGGRGRQWFIREAVLWRLSEDYPPVIQRLEDEIEELRKRVEHLESAQDTSVYLDNLTEVAKTEVCWDDLDRSILSYIIQHDGATTPELAESLLGDDSKRRTVLARINKINERAEKAVGAAILEYKKETIRGKRGAWWLVNAEKIME